MTYPIFNCFAFDNITRLLYGPRHCAYTIENDCQERQLVSQIKQAQLWGPLKFKLPYYRQYLAFNQKILSGRIQSLSLGGR